MKRFSVPCVLALALPFLFSSAKRGPAVHDTTDDALELSVGEKSVRGKHINAFDAKWQSAGGAVISEVATIERRKGKQRLVRVQIWPLGGGLDLRSELVLDRKTLATVSFQQEVVGLSEGMGVGGQPTLLRWDFDGADYTCTVQHGAENEKQVVEGQLPKQMFEGSGLGLVIAALPLEEDYDARLPVAMNLGLTDELTLYNVRVRVSGTESFAWKGKDVEAWVVDVDWEDFATGEVTSAGGADLPGGAYFVVPDAPKGFPPVPRYQNDSTLIDLITEE